MKQLKSSLLNDGLSRGLREVVKAIESGNAHLCFLAEDCNSAEYKQLITALCKSRSVDLLKVPSRKSLGLWAGLGKTNEDGKSSRTLLAQAAQSLTGVEIKVPRRRSSCELLKDKLLCFSPFPHEAFAFSMKRTALNEF